MKRLIGRLRNRHSKTFYFDRAPRSLNAVWLLCAVIRTCLPLNRQRHHKARLMGWQFEISLVTGLSLLEYNRGFHGAAARVAA
jgi:hypothetical protein